MFTDHGAARRWNLAESRSFFKNKSESIVLVVKRVCR